MQRLAAAPHTPATLLCTPLIGALPAGGARSRLARRARQRGGPARRTGPVRPVRPREAGTFRALAPAARPPPPARAPPGPRAPRPARRAAGVARGSGAPRPPRPLGPPETAAGPAARRRRRAAGPCAMAAGGGGGGAGRVGGGAVRRSRRGEPAGPGRQYIPQYAVPHVYSAVCRAASPFRSMLGLAACTSAQNAGPLHSAVLGRGGRPPGIPPAPLADGIPRGCPVRTASRLVSTAASRLLWSAGPAPQPAMGSRPSWFSSSLLLSLSVANI